MLEIYVWSPIFAYIGSAIVASNTDSRYAICPLDCQPRRGGGPYERWGSTTHASIPSSLVPCRCNNSERGWFLCMGCSQVVSPLYPEVLTFPPPGAFPKEATPINHRESTLNCKCPWIVPTLTTKSTTGTNPSASLFPRTIILILDTLMY